MLRQQNNDETFHLIIALGLLFLSPFIDDDFSNPYDKV